MPGVYKTRAAKVKAMLGRSSLNLKRKGRKLVAPLTMKNLAMKIRAARVRKT